MKKIRRGRSVKTILQGAYTVSEFHQVDNLDKKSLSEAQDNYEKAFIVVRQALENNEQYCCDVEEERLNIAQIITDTLKQKLLIRRG